MITVIGNLKGGSGKSTIAFNLAIWLAWQELEVKLLDLDPQKTLTDLVAVRDEEGFTPSIKLLPSDMPLENLRKERGEVIVDVGAANMVGMFAAISQAHRLLIPVVPGQADVWSTQRFLSMIGSHRHPDCQAVMFLNRTDPLGGSKESREAAEAISMLKPATALNARLSQRVWICRTLSEGLAVFEMEPRDKGSLEFLNLTKALYPAMQIKKTW
jgi:chromosome partitioning protein